MLDKIEQMIQKHIGVHKVYLCGSGTVGFFQILKNLSLNYDDEILIPDFICEIVAVPLLNTGVKFQLVDVANGQILPNLRSYQKKYNINTKAILLAYLWGYVHKDLSEIVQWAREKGLIIIEDIASSYGMEYKGKKLGTFGDYAFGSFGQGKIINFGQYGFYTMPMKKTSIQRDFPLFSREILNYVEFVKKIRHIKNNFLRKCLFIFLAKIHPLYLGYSFNYHELKCLYRMLLDFPKIKAQRKKNCEYIFQNIKSNTHVTLYPVNNDQLVASRICCTSGRGTLLQKFQKNNCWVGSDFRYPISKLLNIPTEINTANISDRVFNILTDPDNPTLEKVLYLINAGDLQDEIS